MPEFSHIDEVQDCIAKTWRLPGSWDRYKSIHLGVYCWPPVAAAWALYGETRMRQNSRVTNICIYHTNISVQLLNMGMSQAMYQAVGSIHNVLRTAYGTQYPVTTKISEINAPTQPLGETVVRARWRLFGHVPQTKRRCTSTRYDGSILRKPKFRCLPGGAGTYHSATESAPGPAAYRGVAQETRGT